MIGSQEDDPYDRLAMLLWLLKPTDVARLADVADELVEERLVKFLDEERSGQSPPSPKNRS